MALQQIVDEQQDDLDRFEEAMLASVSAQLKSFKKARTGSLAVQIDRAHTGLNTSHTASNKAHKTRIADLDSLAAQEKSVAESISSTAGQMADFATSQKEVGAIHSAGWLSLTKFTGRVYVQDSLAKAHGSDKRRTCLHHNTLPRAEQPGQC